MGRSFWILVTGWFVNRLGDGFFFPFTALYLNRVHGVPAEQVGLIMAAAGLGSLLGRLPGGALTDRFGFKSVVLVGMAGAGVAVIAAGFAPGPATFSAAYAVLSFLTWGSLPAFTHGLASLAPAHRRDEAFSIMNLVQNAAIAIGPMVGVWLVSRDFRYIFLADGLSFFIFVLILGFLAPGRHPPGAEHAAPPEEWRPAGTPGPRRSGRVLAEVRQVFWLPPASESAFWRVALASCLAALFYSQMGSTLPIDIETRFGRAEWYSLLWTVNGSMIALLQLPLTRWTRRHPRRSRMAAGALIYAGAALTFLVARPVWPYVLGFVILTTGEMLFVPLVPSELAALAPPGQGGRYQAAGSFAHGVGWALGPLVGGQLLGRLGHDALWWAMVAAVVLTSWIVSPTSGREGVALREEKSGTDASRSREG